ncbi:hypothetical protein KJ359_004216 [Pestalotiopsis sp. 9143b]|nr:hypothetical protein KJ359_004216 [Pestalotiopsis sp. 9143b]
MERTFECKRRYAALEVDFEDKFLDGLAHGLARKLSHQGLRQTGKIRPHVYRQITQKQFQQSKSLSDETQQQRTYFSPAPATATSTNICRNDTYPAASVWLGISRIATAQARVGHGQNLEGLTTVARFASSQITTAPAQQTCFPASTDEERARAASDQSAEGISITTPARFRIFFTGRLRH